MTKWLFRALAGAAAGAMLSATAMAQEPVKIGVIMPMSGPSSVSGVDVMNGLRLAIEEVNASGGVLKGRPIELIIEDDEASPTKGTTAARKLIEQDRVVAILGTYNSPTAATALKVAQEAGVPMVSTGSTSIAVTDMNKPGDPWFFRAFPGSDIQGSQSALDTVEKLGAKTIVVLHENTNYGKGLADTFVKITKGAGAKILAVEAFNQGDQDFYATIAKFRSMSPDVVYLGGQIAEGATILRQSSETGFKTRFVGSGSMMTDKFLELSGPAAEGFAVSSMYEPNTPNKYGVEFGKRFEKRWGMAANALSGLGFDAAKVLAAAITRAGSTDRKAIRDALMKSDDVPLALGPDGTTAKFDEKGAAAFKIGLAIVKGGKRTMLPF